MIVCSLPFVCSVFPIDQIVFNLNVRICPRNPEYQNNRHPQLSNLKGLWTWMQIHICSVLLQKWTKSTGTRCFIG